MLTRTFVQLSLLALALCLSPASAFVPVSTPSDGPSTKLSMSSPPADDFDEAGLGATERLLLEKARARDLGLVQEYGKTVKKDGLDGVRAVIWGIFHASQAVFSVLAVALMVGMALNMAGYAYYWDDAGFHVDTMHHLNEIRLFEAETARLASTAEQSIFMR